MMEKNAEKCMGWKIATSGVQPVNGKKHVSVFPTETSHHTEF